MAVASSSKRSSATHKEIPSFGPEYFEYRRNLFLAGLPLPTPNTDKPTIKIPITPPTPLPAKTRTSQNSASVKRLEDLFSDDGVEIDIRKLWDSGLGNVKRNLDDGKRLVRGLRLGLMIKILKAGWIRDGTWPLDPKTAKPVQVPPSPPSKPRGIT